MTLALSPEGGPLRFMTVIELETLLELTSITIDSVILTACIVKDSYKDSFLYRKDNHSIRFQYVSPIFAQRFM